MLGLLKLPPLKEIKPLWSSMSYPLKIPDSVPVGDHDGFCIWQIQLHKKPNYVAV